MWPKGSVGHLLFDKLTSQPASQPARESLVVLDDYGKLSSDLCLPSHRQFGKRSSLDGKKTHYRYIFRCSPPLTTPPLLGMESQGLSFGSKQSLYEKQT